MLKKIFFSLFAVVFFIGAGYIAVLYVDLSADIDKVKHYTPKLASQIYDRKNRLIANIFDTEFRFYAKFDEIPPRMIEALLAIEDTLFFEHSGINYDAIIRAALKNIKSGRFGEGGSTITQQLVKNVILTRERTLSRKVKEALLTIQVEQVITKEQILEIYLNEVFLGHGYYGVKTAAMGYFKKPLSALTLKEIAMIVGLPNAPSFYDPTKNLNDSLGRANDIIRRMYDLGWISKEYRDASLAEVPIVYNQTLTQNVAPYVTDFALRQLSSIPDIKTGGYTIKLNIDLDYQAAAQQALINGYNGIQERLQKTSKSATIQQDDASKTDTLNGAMVVTDTRSGKILALVGGVDYNKSPYNRAVDAKRQIGSSIKPFIYQIALDKGYSTATQIPDAARDFGDYRPGNVDGGFRGLMTLQEALMFSRNLATLNIVQLVGFTDVYSGLLDFGFNDISKDITIGIGSMNVTPLSAARAYSVFSNYGTRVDPVLIDSVIDINGNVFTYDTKSESIIPAAQAFLGVSVLREVVANGTGRRARVNGIEIAGKTGTTNNNVDFWFCGFSPDIQAIIWYGRDDSQPIGQSGSSGLVTAPVFAEFISNALKLDPAQRRKFPQPEGVGAKTIDKYTYYYTSTSPIPSSQNTNTDQNLW
ncbi:penicillin-binding protein 1A [Helicobacter sp. CLO-3]|uniref:transglycosylase domain-containing protein n=1 Tax=unclassified Helicobacter TaxID=2593540 RepID=UPI000805E00F|nr:MULTISPECIES: PBP1A family penicillin-binding protein [unclassified Helicobacter]OBV29319.1 penicillin-binding protein 1A [Helicobacter sp. CLO-3]OHU83349.1 penicillin-binding protein 1A [Helicobacter sp. CLO-3]